MKGIAFTVTGSEPFNSNVKELRRIQRHQLIYGFFSFVFASVANKPVFRVLGTQGHQLTYTLVVPAQYNSTKRFRRRRRGEFRNLKKLYNKD